MKISFWEIVRRLLRIESGNASSTLSALACRFPFPRDVERAESRLSDSKVYRPSSRASMETAAREYVVISNADLRNPFADYLADDAKVWSMYLDLTKSKGEELMRIWNADLDTILIFAGLFSAILTAFLIETRKNLQQDPQDVTNNLIKHLIQTLSSEAQQSSLSSTKFVPSSPLVWVNGLWFVSLTFALTGAFGTILAKGWVSQFIPVSAGLPIVDACNRHRRFFGDDQRHLRAVILALPITLHIAFYLFFGGLVILLFQDDPRIGIVVTTLIAITMLLYLGCSVRPILNPNSPFRTPISGLLPIIPGILIPLILLGDTIGYLAFSPRHRRYKARRITGAYTRIENFFLFMTKLRRLWMNGIMDTIASLYHLMLVSNPPSDELRTDVLVGLFSLARTFKLDDPVCAIAGLPMTSRLQEALYTADPLPALTRNIGELFSSLEKTESSDVARAYLTVLLSLVQTTHSSLNWSANSLVRLLQPGGILSNWDMFQDDILELIICVHIHVRIRSGFLIPAEFTNRIPDVIANCTNPLHRQWLIEASFILSAMDKGLTLKCLAANERMHPMLLGPELGITLSNMIRHPQKRVQRAVLSSVSAIGVHESGNAALIHQDIIGLLLDYIPGSDSQFQCEALLTFEVFLRFGGNGEIDNDQESVYNQAMLEPWIESILSLFLAAMLKSEHMNVQEAAVIILSAYLRHDYPREQFNHLNHTSALLNMLETGDSNLQIASMKVLNVILQFEDSRSRHTLLELSRAIGSAMAQNKSEAGIHRHILDFVHKCLAFGDLKEALLPSIMDPLIDIFKFGKSMSEFTDKLFSFLYVVSCDDSINHCLFNADVILFQLNTISNTDAFNLWSIDITYQSLVNILDKHHDKNNFLTLLRNDIKNHLVSAGLIHTMIYLLGRPEPSLQALSMDLLTHCLKYLDLRQELSYSTIVPRLIQRLDLGEPSVKKASLNVLLELINHDHMKPLIVQSTGIVDSLLTIIWRDWAELSGMALELLEACMLKPNNEYPTSSLSDSTPTILSELLSTKKYHETMAALLIISRCSECNRRKSYGTIMKFFSTEIFMKVIEIFDLTSELEVQENVMITLEHIIDHAQLRPVIVMESLVRTLLHASMSSDGSFKLTALNLLLKLLRCEPTIPSISNLEYMDILLVNLASRDSAIQLSAIDIVLEIAGTENGRNTIIQSSVLEKIMELGTSPNNYVSKAVIVGIRCFYGYDDLRGEIDITILMKLVTDIINTKDATFLLSELLYTFRCIMQYRDIHHKVIHPVVIKPLYQAIFQSTNPLTARFNLINSKQYYLLKIWETIKEADGEALKLLTDDLCPPLSPFEHQIASAHASLDFPNDTESRCSTDSVINDAESVVLQLDTKETHDVP